jgi:hypothetical protein
MRTLTTSKCVGFLLVVAVMMTVTKVVPAQDRPQADKQEPRNARAEERMQVVEAMRKEGLRGAAKLKGTFVTDYDPYHHQPPFGLEELTRNSEVAIVGAPTRNIRSKLSTDGLDINTEYEVVVQETLKGDLPMGSTITVSLPGGKVKFTDGTSAEIKVIEFTPMRPDAVYTLYLNRNEEGMYILTAGPYGLLEMLGNGKVRSHARAKDAIALETKDREATDFLKHARKLAKKHPLPGKCCSSY